MELFNYKLHALEVNPLAFQIEAFNNIWKKYRNKNLALAEFSYIYFVGSYRSDFSSILDDKSRKEKVIQDVLFNTRKKLRLDKLTEIAIEKLKELEQTPTLIFLDTALKGIEKVRKLIDDTEVSDTKDGLELLKLISTAPALVVSLENLKKKIQKEASDDINVKGSKEKGMFED
jgi:hypothetical protein